jgi:penicillin-binding protein 1A
LEIYTTLDIDMQKNAQDALWDKIKKQNEIYNKNILRINEYFDDNFTDLISLLGIALNNEKLNKLTDLKEIRRINHIFQYDLADEINAISLIFGCDDLHKFISKYKNKEFNPKYSGKVEGALIAIEPKTGYIKAMVGGSGFSTENQLNRAVQAHRQAGSSFKPFVYVSALDTGEFTPATTFVDEPIVYIDKEGNEWIPNNYSGKYYGLVTLRKALQHSINIISVKLADKIGIDKVRDIASRLLHIYSYKEKKKYLPDDLSLALGTASVTPLQMATAFAIFANGGKNVIPISIRYISDRHGNLIKNYEYKILSKPRATILTPQIAFLITDMLKSIFKPGGTAWGAAVRNNFFLPASGKTGTTDNWRDTWFVGYNKALAAAVWMGFDNPKRSLGVGQDAGHVAAPVWMKFFQKTFKNTYVPDFTPPDNIIKKVICLHSGKLPSNYCKEIGTEYFLKGTEPTEVCTECQYGYKKYELYINNPWTRDGQVRTQVIQISRDSGIPQSLISFCCKSVSVCVCLWLNSSIPSLHLVDHGHDLVFPESLEIKRARSAGGHAESTPLA